MKQEEFFSLVKALAFNFGFNVEGEVGEKWLGILLKKSSRFNTADIKYGINEMFNVTNKQWSEDYKISYGKPPAIEVWMEFFRLRSKHQIIAKKDEVMAKALYNNRNGIITKKVKRVKDPVSNKSIQETINKLTDKFTIN